MILVFDVGNTELTIGLFSGAASPGAIPSGGARGGARGAKRRSEEQSGELRGHWRVMTDTPRTADEFGVLLQSLLASNGFRADEVDGAAIGSVVPRVTRPLADACRQYFPVSAPLIVDAKAKLPITLDVDEPLTVGADRLINTLAASRLYARDAIVVDMGTAMTFDCITAEGVFLGGVIAPGVMTASETLTRRTSKLPATELEVPSRVIGKRTEECIRAGVMFGAADAIDGIVARIKEEWPRSSEPLVVATGGYVETMAALCRSFDRVEPYLTLQGLQMAHTLLSPGAK